MLPTVKTKKAKTLQDLVLMVYGQTKIGKSKFCSHFPNPLFLSGQGAYSWLELYNQSLSNWGGLPYCLRRFDPARPRI